MSLPTVNKSEKLKKTLTLLILCVLVPAVVLIGALVFGSRSYAWISLCVVVLSIVPFFMRFEKSSLDVKRLVLIAALVALSVVGRMAFAAVPGFKPVAALVIITAVHFGGEAGFMVGALSALLSNFYFGQGPWTPFQMFSWGIVGLIAGLLAPVLKKHLVALTAHLRAACTLCSWTYGQRSGRTDISTSGAISALSSRPRHSLSSTPSQMSFFCLSALILSAKSLNA